MPPLEYAATPLLQTHRSVVLDHITGSKNPADGHSRRPDYAENVELPSGSLIPPTFSSEFIAIQCRARTWQFVYFSFGRSLAELERNPPPCIKYARIRQSRRFYRRIFSMSENSGRFICRSPC